MNQQNKIIDGKLVSSKVYEQLKKRVENHKLPIGLAIIQIGQDEASNVYIKNKQRVATDLDIKFMLIKLDKNVSEKQVIDEIKKLNEDNEITGILLQLPIPDHLNAFNLIGYIDPSKDVDGMHPVNRGLIDHTHIGIKPCTPLGIMALLEFYKINPSGKNCVVIGRSMIVGKPIASLMLHANATTTICHSKTRDIARYTKDADIIIVAIGQSKFLKKEMIKEGAVIIDVGINRNGSELTGDVDYADVIEKCGMITPVPGGVGPMTVAMLMQNLINASVSREKMSKDEK